MGVSIRRRILWWLDRCEHEWEPYFYGRVYGQEDLFVVIDVCTRCGQTVARCP